MASVPKYIYATYEFYLVILFLNPWETLFFTKLQPKEGETPRLIQYNIK